MNDWLQTTGCSVFYLTFIAIQIYFRAVYTTGSPSSLTLHNGVIIILRWPTTLTAKLLTSRQKKPHGKMENSLLTGSMYGLFRDLLLNDAQAGERGRACNGPCTI